MKLENARELKAAVVGELDRLATKDREETRALGLGLPAQRIDTLGCVQPTMAVGIVRKGKTDYHLAVRVQRRQMLSSPLLEKLRQRVKREIDVRYVGRVEKRSAVAAPVLRAAGMLRQTAAPRRRAFVAPAPHPSARRRRPLRIGCSIAHHAMTPGTLGCFVVQRRCDGRTSDRLILLSNNHVLAAENAAQLGDPIIRPSDFDDDDDDYGDDDIVGSLEDFVRLRAVGANLVDAAIAGVKRSITVDSKPVAELGKSVGQAQAELLDVNMPVAKLGRTTGLTRGRMTAFELDNLVVAFDMGYLRFDNQIEIESAGDNDDDDTEREFSDGGDCGSLVVDSDRQALALVFAGSDQGAAGGKGFTYANSIIAVCDALHVEIA